MSVPPTRRRTDKDTRRRAVARAFGREETRQPDDAQRREHPEDESTRRDALPPTKATGKITRRHAPARAFGRDNLTTRSGASIRKRQPDDA